MQNIHHMIDRFSGQYHRQILKITEPLQHHFGISYFAYQRVSYEGAWTVLGNNPDWLIYCAANHYYRHDPSLVHPKNLKTGVCFPAAHDEKEFQNCLVKDAINTFDLNHCMAIFEKTDEGCDFYFFGAPTQHLGVFNFYFSHMDALRYQFTHYFKQELGNILLAIDDHAVDLNSLKKDLYTSPPHLISISNSDDMTAKSFLGDLTPTQNNTLTSHIQSKALISSIRPNELTSHTQSNTIIPSASPNVLTPREEQCLQLYRLGKTAKETARILSLSPRTVEEYLNNIKAKYGCRFKRELLAIID